jgi:hypothetical protein
MGQYHILVNLTKKQFVCPGGLGRGLKQVEHIDRVGQAMYILTMVPEGRGGGDILLEGGQNLTFIGSWLGDKIAIVGDYTVDKDLPTFPNFGSIYRECSAQSNPIYDCWGMRRKSKDPNNVWRDITADLVVEMREYAGIDWIPMDHPTLWPDGERKPEEMVERARKAKELMKDWHGEVQ